MSSTAEMPAEDDWQGKARDFARARLMLYGVQTAVGLLFPLLFWRLGGSATLEGLLGPLSTLRWLETVLFLLVYEVITAAIFLPFSYFGGFILQHRFGLSRQNRSGWLSDWVKSTLIGAFFFIAGMTVFYLLAPAFPSSWWWILAIAVSVMALILTYIAPVLLL